MGFLSNPVGFFLNPAQGSTKNLATERRPVDSTQEFWKPVNKHEEKPKLIVEKKQISLHLFDEDFP